MASSGVGTMSERVVVLSRDHEELVPAVGASTVWHGTGDPEDVVDGEILLADPFLVPLALGRMPSLRWIQATWAGVDAILASGLPPGVLLTRLTDVFGPQMREFVFGHLLAHAQRVSARETATAWDDRPPAALAGTRVGILGTGSIGRVLAETAVHLEMEVVGCSRSGSPVPPFGRVFPADDKAVFAEGLDHLVVVVPATTGTKGIVDRTVLDGLAQGATLVNVGRGDTVDVEYVVARLRSGHLSRAVLDVLPVEPLPPDHPWWSVPNLVITSHTAAVSRPRDVATFFVSNLERLRNGLPLRGTVDVTAGY